MVKTGLMGSTCSVWRRPLSRQRLSVILLIALVGLALPQPGYAADKPRSLIELFFGVKKPVEQKPPAPPRKKKKKVVKANVARQAVPQVNVQQKLPTASRILVMGDFFAKGIGTGLDAAFQTMPGIAIDVRSTGPAGLVRDDLFDWSRLMPTYLDEVRPAMVIVSLGANDRQQMKVDGLREKFNSVIWASNYERRVAAVTKLATDRKIPLLWVGLPSFASDTMSQDAVTINTIIETGVQKAGGEFVDIWEGFVDDSGQFTLSGSDINGQQVRLRSSDGVGMTSAGKRKVAFYLEKPVRRILGTSVDEGGAVIGSSNLPDLMILPPVNITKPSRTPPIGINDPELDGGNELLGANAGQNTATSLSTFSAITARAPKGRLDDFSLPEKQ
jgi:uncharacterized protein